MTLGEYAKRCPLIESVQESTLESAIALCYERYPLVDHDGILVKHKRLQRAEKEFNNTCKPVLNNATAYSIFAGYHAQFLQASLAKLIPEFGNAIQTTFFDVHYFAGRNDMLSPRWHGLRPHGFHQKALQHFTSAYNQWNHIAAVHTEIGYRHARIAQVCAYRWLLGGGMNDELVKESVYHAQHCDDFITGWSKDAPQVIRGAQELAEMFWKSGHRTAAQEFDRLATRWSNPDYGAERLALTRKAKSG